MIFNLSHSGYGPKKPWRAGPFRKLLYALGALAALFGALAGVTSTEWFRQVLERQVISRLEDLTGGRVEIRALRFNPAILQVTFQGVIVHGAEGPSESPLFAAKTVVARLSLVPLARRRLRLRRVEWEQAEIHLVTRRGGATNFPGPRTSLRADQALDELVGLSIERLNLIHTQIEWNDQRLPLELDARNVDIRLRHSGVHRFAGSLSSFPTRIKSRRWSSPPISFTSQFELSRGGLNFESIAWQSPSSAGQCSFLLRNLASPEGTFSFQARGEISDFTGALQVPGLRSGSINLEGRADYREGELAAQGRFAVHKLIFQSPGFSPGPWDLSADYLANGQHVELSNLTATALIGVAQGRAKITFREPSPDFVLSAQLRGLDLAAVLRSFPTHQPTLRRLSLAGRVDGPFEAAWSGLLENFKSRFDLQLHPLTTGVPGAVPASGHARGQATMTRTLFLRMDEAELHTPHSTASAQGNLGAPHEGLAFELVTSDFEEWRPLVEYLAGVTGPIPLFLESPVTLSGKVSGPLARPKIRGRLTFGSFRYRGGRWDGLSANVAAAPDCIDISASRLRRGTSVLTLNASARSENWLLVPHSQVHLSAQAQHMSLGGIRAALDVHYPFSGFATGRLDLEGTAADLAGTGDLRVEQGAYAQEPFDLLSVKVRVAATAWNFNDIQLNKGPGRLSGQVKFDPVHRFFSAELHGADFSLADFKRLSVTDSKDARPTRLDGQAGLDLRGEGTPEDLRLHSTWTVRNIHLNSNAVGDFRGHLDWEGKQMQFEGNGEGPGGLVHFSGGARTVEDWPLELSGNYQNFIANPWIHQLLRTKFNALVTASGSFSAAGPLKEPGRLQARSQAQYLEIKFPSLTWKNEQPVDLHYAAGVLTADRFRMRGPSTDLEVEGSIRFGESATLSVKAHGQADAALLSLIDPALQATGRSELNLGVKGTPAQPLLNGTLDVQDMSLVYGDLPFRVTGLNGEIRLEGETATAQSLHGVSGGGSVTLAGFVTLSETPRYELRADLDRVRVPYPRDFTSVLNGGLRLVGTSERGQLEGELTVRQMLVSENFRLLERLAEGSTPAAERMSGVASPLASKVRLNIQVSSSPPVRLETHDWSVLADLDLRLQGTLASPVEFGIIQLRSGEAIFRGTRYKLTRGEIRMSSPFRTQPLLDLEATTRVERYDLTIDISGPFDRLKVVYRSDPPLPTTDILSLLALGFSRQQSEMSTAVSRPMPAVEAGSLLSQALSSQVGGRVQRLFGVSRVKIDPNVGGPGNTSGARVTVEQQVTRDLTLTYVTNTASSQYRVIQFEWALSDTTSLVGVRDQNGIFGMELKFHRRFR